MAPLEEFLEESGEPHLIIDRLGRIAFATAAAKSLLGVAATLHQFDADNSLADLLAEWFAQRQCFGYSGAATLRAGSGASEMCLMSSTIEYRGARHLLCRLRPVEPHAGADMHLWSDVTDATRESAFAAAGALVEHELNQSLTAIVNYVQTSAVLLSARPDDAEPIRSALLEAGQQALHCAELLRVLRRKLGYQHRSLSRHSIAGAVRRAHGLLADTPKGRAIRLELQSGTPELFAQLSHARFVSMLLLLMQRCLLRPARASKSVIRVRIESEGDEHAVVRFLNCGGWDLDGVLPGRIPIELYPSEHDDVRLLAICQATMSLHGGHISVAEEAGRNADIKLILKKARAGESQHV